jgi:outer membrane biosynthesis protein TonB
VKRILTMIAAVALLLITALPVVAGEAKVTLCHAAGLDGTTQFVTLTVAYPAAYGPAGHFNENGTPNAGHEQDYLGECTPPPPPPPTPEPKDCVGDKCEPTPTPAPTESPVPTPTPTVAPSASPTPTVAPSPSSVPTAKPTTPPTDTVGSTGGTSGGGFLPVLLLLAAVSASALALTRKRA